MNDWFKRKSFQLFPIAIILLFFFLSALNCMAENTVLRGVVSSHLDGINSLNQNVINLAKQSASLHLDQHVQQGNLLAMNLHGYQEQQGKEVKIEKIVVIDLSNREIIYDEVFSNQTMTIGLYQNVLIYSQKPHKESGKTQTRMIDLTDKNNDKEIKGYLSQITSKGIIFCRDTGDFIDISSGEVIFHDESLKHYSAFLAENGFFIKRKNDRGNWDSYQFANYEGEIIFSLSPYDQILLPKTSSEEILSFPLPVLWNNEEGKEELQVIDDSGNIIQSFLLNDLGIAGTVFGKDKRPQGKLEILLHYESNDLLSITAYDENSKRKRHYIWLNTQTNEIKSMEEQTRLIAEFTPEGNIIALAESETEYGHFTMRYYQNDGSLLWEKYLPPEIDSWPEINLIGSKSALVYDNHSTFFKYSLSDGTLTGLYPIPDYKLAFAAIYDEQVYIVTGQKYKNMPTELEGNHLVSFSVNDAGWLDLQLVSLSPLAGEAYSVYEDSEIDVRFELNQSVSLPVEGISISFEKGEVLEESKGKYGRLDYLWQSPELLQEESETIIIIAAYGPISKTYQVKVKPMRNPLIVGGQLTVDAKNPHILLLEGKVKNPSHIDIEAISWQWTTDNLSLISSSFPDRISAGRERDFKMRLDRLAIDDSQWELIKYNGYVIPQKVSLSCDYPQGHDEKVFEYSLNILPEHEISFKLYDPITKKSWSRKDLENLNLSGFEAMNEKGDNITSSLQFSKNLSKKCVQLNGLAGGIKEKPVKIGVSYNGKVQWYALKFQSDKYPRFPKLAEDSFQFDLPVAPGILVKVIDNYTLKPIEKVSVYLRRKNEDDDIEEIAEKQTDQEGKCNFSDIEPGDYLIETSKEGYIATNLQIPSGGYIETHYSVQMAEQKEIDLTLVPYTGVLFKAESYYDSFYKDVSKLDLLKSIGMNEASEHVFILPENVSYIFFSLLYKVGYSEDAAIGGWFAEDHYKVALEIEDENGALVNEIKVSRGKKIKTFTEEDIYIRGDQSNQDFGEIYYDADSITKPTPFTFKLKTQDNDWKSSTLWIFPYEWKDYEKEALQVSLLYPLKNTLDTFDYATEAREFLKEEGSQVDLQAALSPIIDYGIEALKIFGEFPDESFKENIKDSAKDFLQGKIKGALEETLGVARVSVISEVLNIVLMMINAIDWGEELDNVAIEGESEVYSTNCIDNLAYRANLQNSERLLGAIKGYLPQLFEAAETNQPMECRDLIENLRTIIIGNHPDGENASDYVIDYGQFGVSPVENSTGYALIFNLCFELANIVDVWSKDVAPCFDEFIKKNASESALELASQKAMLVYKPIIKNLIQIISIPLNVVLLE